MNYNLKITAYNNLDYEQSFTLKDENDVVIDLTGKHLIFAFGTAFKTLGSHNSTAVSNKCVFITDAANGGFTLKLPYSVLKSLAPDTYIHDLVLVGPDGKRTGVWNGSLIIKRGIG